MESTIKVNYKSTTNAFMADKWLNELPDLFAADFEVAVKYSEEQLAQFAQQLETSTDKMEQVTLQSKLDATALGHPSHCEITHLSIAWSESDSFVLILDNIPILNVALRFLIRTKRKQVWHNASYDFRLLMYFTKQLPSNYEDTQILAKTLVNHVEVHKAITGLKQLAGHRYGAWGISSDNFVKSQMYEDHVIKYAATDSCSTYWLWVSIQSNLHKERSA